MKLITNIPAIINIYNDYKLKQIRFPRVVISRIKTKDKTLIFLMIIEIYYPFQITNMITRSKRYL